MAKNPKFVAVSLTRMVEWEGFKLSPKDNPHRMQSSAVDAIRKSHPDAIGQVEDASEEGAIG